MENRILNFLFSEITFRKRNFILSVMVVSASICSIVYLINSNRFSQFDDNRITSYLGYSTVLVSDEAVESEFLKTGFTESTFPLKHFEQISDTEKTWAIEHITALLYIPEIIQNKNVFLIGLKQKRFSEGNSAQNIFSITLEFDQIHIGSDAAEILSLKKGDFFSISNKDYIIKGILPHFGSSEDLGIIVPLNTLYNLYPEYNGKISMIKYLGYPIEEIDWTKYRLKEFANTRILNSREQVTEINAIYHYIVIALFILVSFAVITFLLVFNAQSRANEFKILLLLGYDIQFIHKLFLLRSTFIALLGILIPLFVLFFLFIKSLFFTYWSTLPYMLIIPLLTLFISYIVITVELQKLKFR